MKMNSFLATGVGLGAFLLLGASSCKMKTVELTIFHTNDLHSALSPPRSNPFQLGGLARLSTLLQRLRAESPNSLTIDAGDWSEGKWHFSLDMGQNMLKFLAAMKYDVSVLGNHDFFSGPDRVADTILSANVPFPVLAANLDLDDFPNAEKIRKALPPTFMTEVNGIKVGVIGLTTNSILFDSFLKPVRIMNPLWTAEKLALLMRPKVDVLILLSHNDFPVNVALASAVPGVDLVISGHTHKKTPSPKMAWSIGRDVPVVEAGKWGEFVGEAKLEVNRITNRTSVKSYRLIPVTRDLPEDPVIAKAVSEQDALLSAKFGDDIHRVVTRSEINIRHDDQKESTLANLAAKAYREATGADVAMEESGLVGVDVPRGPVTLKDLHDVAPHLYNPDTGKEWTLQVWNARGKDLNRIYQVFYTVNGFMPLGWTVGWLSAANLEFIWDPTLFGRFEGPVADPADDVEATAIPAVQFITIGGQPLDREGIYSVAVTQGLFNGLRSASNKLKLKLDFSNVVDTGIESWRSVVDYAARGDRLTKENLRIGRGARTQTADLAVFDYGIEWNGETLLIEVENLGLTTSLDASLSCFSGLRDNPVVFETSEQQWTEIGSIPISRLKPGATTTVGIPWKESVLIKGRWPVRCTVTVEEELFLENNTGALVFPVPGERRL
ncbi:MAG: hypothetical protein A2X94_14895 [Bdellovibrionales bacterium GWB1_55_8]|nr:MAG: hypothetical protein A2X94_14895 [Bdellovibrionales bacterium GWB1_55_8]